MVEGRLAKLRLFFALWPDPELRKCIASDVESALRSADRSSINPVEPENYHITLAFLGSVSASSLDDIVRVCSDVHFGRFSLELDRTGYWPRARIVWLGPSRYSLELEALVDDLWNKLMGLGFRQEPQPYQPHVSLCRKAGSGLGMSLDSPINWPVASFVLVQSTPGEDGPVYTVLEQFAAGN